ncbi:hypothetical protein [Rubrivirga marina]|uniref:Uncharacterized protein n=1 Tax=Rubrivirga marina TaxID=1196024 RepID=A0A271IX98_9BACT|nr:hypothetical protein [Rubrivirga marina]PAP75444.1 hypothetical protein BSZ37_02780 [Rubrivirga marina]
MSDAPPPPASAPPPTSAPAPSPRRTFFARLAAAVRRQDWFVVCLEVGIVVLGVVIGFQVTSWGQAQSDRAKEQTYLRQLSRDLAETERLADDLARTMAPLERAPRRLAQAHYLPEPPPRDSVIHWAAVAPAYWEISPVLGTAEALVSTGDIGLIRDDSLRIAITAYLEKARENIRGWGAWKDVLLRQTDEYGATTPVALLFAEWVGPAALDSLDRADDWMALAPPGVALPALDTDALVRDEQVHRLMVRITIAKDNMAINRREIAQYAAALREQVEAELDR